MRDLNRDNLKNLYIYGVSYSLYDTIEISSDIITNIRMRFLQSQKSASNKLYRSAKGENLVYSYNFTVNKPLQWKVLRNRKVVEEIEQLSSDKYCVNYYDTTGKDIKKVLFNSSHDWFKTNYYNRNSNVNLVCSLVPKEFEQGTAILKYITGAVYPERLYPCCIPSCKEVRDRLFNLYPIPEVSALTNIGIVHFLAEADKRDYEELLLKIENEYEVEHAPEIYVTEEDAKGGFNLNVNDFDMNKNLNRTFDISLAENFAEEETPAIEEVTPTSKSENTKDTENIKTVEEAIAEVVDKINAKTSLSIDADDILNFDISGIEDEKTSDTSEDYINFDDNDPIIDEKLKHIDSVLDEATLLTSDKQLIIGDSVVDEDYISSIIDGIISQAFDTAENSESVTDEESTKTETNVMVQSTTEATDTANTAVDSNFSAETYDILIYEPEAYNQSDSSEAVTKEMTEEKATDTVEDEVISDETPTQDDMVNESSSEISADVSYEEETTFPLGKTKDFIDDNSADLQIESRGEAYYYYGDLDASGKRNGRGRTLMSDGSIAYEGEYTDDMRNGKGSFYFKDGTLCYWGQWNNNVRHGFGVGISSDDKAVHAGNFAENKPSGAGVRFDSDGNLQFISSNCEDKKKGITISELTDKSFIVRVWSDKDDAFIQREIFVSDLLK